jgi:hypothetical protein
MRVFQTKFVKKVKTHILCSVIFLQKLRHLLNNVEKYCRDGWATDDTIIWCIHFACCLLVNTVRENNVPSKYELSQSGC